MSQTDHASRPTWLAYVLTILFFAVANVGMWYFLTIPKPQAGPAPLTVLNVSPWTSRRGRHFPAVPISLRFNRPVVAADFVHKPLAVGVTTAAPRITPATDGAWRWATRSELEFLPSRPWRMATHYTVYIPAETVFAHGAPALRHAFHAAFNTARLRVLHIRQVAYLGLRRYMLAVQFNEPVLPAEALAHLSAHTHDNHPVLLTLRGRQTKRTINVIAGNAPELGQRTGTIPLTVHVSRGLAGVTGPRPLARGQTMTINLQPALAVTSAVGHSPANGEPYIRLRFNEPINGNAMHYHFQVDPKCSFTPLLVAYESNTLQLRGKFKPGRRYAVSIVKPRGPRVSVAYPRLDSFGVIIPDRQPAVRFTHIQGYLTTRGNEAVIAHVMNCYHLHVLVTRVHQHNVLAWQNYGASCAQAGPVLVRHALQLPLMRNRAQTVRLSLPKLLHERRVPPGIYQISLINADGANDGPLAFDTPDQYNAVNSVVTLSDIGLTAKVSARHALVWATSLRTGQPLPGVIVQLYSNKDTLLAAGVTGVHGLAHLLVKAPPPGESAAEILAALPGTHDGAPRDSTWLNLAGSALALARYHVGGKPYTTHGMTAFVYSARGIYRPGETAHLYAIVRGPHGSVPSAFPLTWQFFRPDGRPFFHATTGLRANGMAAISLRMPRDVPTGRWNVRVGLAGAGPGAAAYFGQAHYLVEDFQPDQIRVKLRLTQAKLPGKGRVLTGKEQGRTTDVPRLFAKNGPIRAAVQARFLFGQPAANLSATLSVRTLPMHFYTRKFPGFTFFDQANVQATLTGKHTVGALHIPPPITLNAQGDGQWTTALSTLLPDKIAAVNKPIGAAPGAPGPWRCIATVTVHDQGGRAVSDTELARLYGVPDYLGMKLPDNPAPDRSISVQLVLANYRGGLAARNTAVQLQLYQETWVYSVQQKQGHFYFSATERLVPIQGGRQIIHIAAGRGMATVKTPASGSYVLSAVDQSTGAQTSLEFYASGPGGYQGTVSRSNPEGLQLLILPPHAAVLPLKQRRLDRNAKAQKPYHFAPGQQAKILVNSPFTGTLLLTEETSHVLFARVVRMTGRQAVVEVPVTAACQPNAYITASVVRGINPHQALWAVHRAYGVAELHLRHANRRLAVTVHAPRRIRPNHPLGITVQVKLPDGRPAAHASVTVAVVDEGICQLTAFHTPQPLKFFTAKCALGALWTDAFDLLMPEAPRGASAVGGDAGEPYANHLTPVLTRRIKPVAFASQILRTNAQGVAKVTFHVPQFLGELRTMAVACRASRYGSARQDTLVRSRLIVRSAWPRFAAPGDTFLAPLTLVNHTGKPGVTTVRVTIAHDVAGLLTFGRNRAATFVTIIPLKAGAQAALDVPVHVGALVGVGHVIMRVALNGRHYRDRLNLPVRPANPRRTIAGALTLLPGHAQRIAIPGGFLPGTIRCRLAVQRARPAHILSGLEYLDHYPYGCAEQTVSTCLPLLFLHALHLHVPAPAMTRAAMQRRIHDAMLRLSGMQTSDGGVAMWAGETKSWRWASVYAAYFVTTARRAGYQVPQELRRGLLRYLRGRLVHGGYGRQSLETQAYACYVLALAGQPRRAVMDHLAAVLEGPHWGAKGNVDKEELLESRGLLAAALVASGEVRPATGLLPRFFPRFSKKGRQTTALDSRVRTQAILLQALLMGDPSSPLVGQLAQQLSAEGRRHQWRSTQDVAFAVMALGEYRAKFGRAAPYHTVSLLNMAGQPMAAARAGQPLLVTQNILWPGYRHGFKPATAFRGALRITGPANSRGYVQWRESGVPLAPAPARSHGLTIRESYWSVRGRRIGSDQLASGQLVRVRLSVIAAAPVRNLVINAMLPAGLSVENPDLKTSAAKGAQAVPAFQHATVDARDDRVIIVGNLKAGTGHFSYLARAGNVGRYAIPPVQVQAMYDRSLMGRSAAGTLTVVPAGQKHRRPGAMLSSIRWRRP